MAPREIQSVDVSLRSDGETLQEYADDSSSTHSPAVTAKYILAPSGAVFSIYVQISPGSPYFAEDISVKIKLDGRPATSKIISSKPKYSKQGFRAHHIDGITSNKSGHNTLERFKFTQLTTGTSLILRSRLLYMLRHRRRWLRQSLRLTDGRAQDAGQD